MDIQQFKDYLLIGLEENYTDITMKAGSPVIYGYCDKFWEWTGENLKREDIRLIARYLMESQLFPAKDNTYVDSELSYELVDPEKASKVIGRFRVSIYTEMGDYCLSIRVIPTKPLYYEQLNLPGAIIKLSQLQRGLILVTGATGQGKSTTIAALINEINKSRKARIVTIEDPVEFTYEKKEAFIIQREIGLDIPNYQIGIKQALRQRPNVIMVGEIRDKETLEAVMLAAQTGHLVISSIHTTDVKTTLSEIMSYYSNDREYGINRLSNNLVAVISQRLLPTKKNMLVRSRNILGDRVKVSVVPACEVLMMTETVKEVLKKGELDKLVNIMETDKGYYGMQTFDQDISRLYHEDKISKETACSAASKPDVIERSEILSGKNLPVNNYSWDKLGK